jgi:pilus assembly protein CpaF
MVVQVSRLSDGSRKIVSIAEVTGVEDEAVQIQEVFTFERVGVNDAGKVQGRFKSVCRTPKVLERIRLAGIALPPDIFDEVMEVNL